MAQTVKNLPATQETWVRSPGEGDSNPLQYFSLENLAGYSRWDHRPHQKSGRLQSMGSQSQTQPSAHVPKEASLHGTHPIFSLLSLRISFTRSPTLHPNLCESRDSTLKNPCGSPLPAWIHAKSLHWCPALCDPMDCSPPGFSVHGILQARILEWIAMPSSRGSSGPRDQT